MIFVEKTCSACEKSGLGRSKEYFIIYFTIYIRTFSFLRMREKDLRKRILSKLYLRSLIESLILLHSQKFYIKYLAHF